MNQSVVSENDIRICLFVFICVFHPAIHTKRKNVGAIFRWIKIVIVMWSCRDQWASPSRIRWGSPSRAVSAVLGQTVHTWDTTLIIIPKISNDKEAVGVVWGNNNGTLLYSDGVTRIQTMFLRQINPMDHNPMDLFVPAREGVLQTLLSSSVSGSE